MKFKKATLASLAVFSFSVSAVEPEPESKTVTFNGIVVAPSCTTTVQVNGSTSYTIELGKVTTNTTSDPVAFKILASAAEGGACAAPTAHLTWEATTGAFTSEGLGNTGVEAADAVILLTAEPDSGNEAITESNKDVLFTGLDDGMLFNAKLKAGTETGTFTASASYSIYYY
ncbi:hypothetical protein M445_05640 [Vibrio owensii 47666-1]|uniref:hypothetical protein n=1 Tax=Vibrio owensii TaxID=696485 RepID=UPI000584719B|nr:hypothetical protein [Vibrio owensii]KIF48819.1 hypothetical protein M445_05640 [Vibrio owensii 47666-1]